MIEITSVIPNPITFRSYSTESPEKIGSNIEVEFILFDVFVCNCEFEVKTDDSWDDIKKHIESKLIEGFTKKYLIRYGEIDSDGNMFSKDCKITINTPEND